MKLHGLGIDLGKTVFHLVGLLAQYVKPYVQTNKGDYLDAEPERKRCNVRGGI